MSAAHVTGVVVWRDGRFHLEDPFVFNAGVLRKLKPGEGQSFVMTVMPEEDAIRHGQYKHLFGHVIEPLSEYTGYSKPWWHEVLKALFYPKDGTKRTSLVQLSEREFADYISTCEEFARVEFWEAFDDAEELAA